MRLNRTTILLLCLLIISGCKPRKTDQTGTKQSTQTNSELSGNFRITGAYALYPLVNKWSNDFMKLHPGVKIVITTGGTGVGIDDLRSKKTQLAMISRPLTDEDYKSEIWTVPVAKDGVAAIINQRNPYIRRVLNQGLSPDEFLKVFTSDKAVTWGELVDSTGKDKVMVFKRSDESGASDIFADFLFTESNDLKGISVASDEEMIKNIQENPLSIGFSNFSYAFDISTGERKKDIQIVPADLNYDNKINSREIPFSNLEKAHRGLWLGLYSKKLCRELSIGSVRKPTDPAILEFLKYTLTVGQKDIKTSGLCELNDVYIGYALDKLK